MRLSLSPPFTQTPLFLPLPSVNKPALSLSFPSTKTNKSHSLFLPPPHCHPYPRSLSSDIDLVPTQDGLFVPKPNKVVVLWDLDNKPPRGPPYDAARALLALATRFGEVVDISAYANRHAFTHLPTWVLEQRRERRRMDVLERKGVVTPPQPYICSVCGRKCKTHLDLKKHFQQLHERERQKKLNRMKQLKGKKRQRFKERYLEKDVKFEEGARRLVLPKVGYGLAKELRRAGVFVKTVEDKPQAADWALKRQMMHSMSRGIDWLVLVSDDSDFGEMLRRAREARVGTVVVGDTKGVLGRNADVWLPWGGVETGEEEAEEVLSVSISGWEREGESEWEQIEEEVRVPRSAFSDGEEEEDEDEDEDDFEEEWEEGDA